MEHRQVATNGIELHVAEEGSGRPVVFLHGFPELWYSWRHQIPAIAAAGFRAIAPDLRGYGGSSVPEDPESYDLVTAADDVLGMLDALGEESAIVVGHDIGAMLAWGMALLHPERVDAVAGLSVPFLPRTPVPPVELMRQAFGDDFYIVWFQSPGVADEALGRDVRRTLATTTTWNAEWAARDEQPPLPRHLSEDELGVYVEAFERTGFTGGLNWYRNFDRTWERTEPVAARKVDQPALFITGSRDPVQRFAPAAAMEGWVTDLRGTIVVEGAGHWVNQERPDEVNAALIEFLRGV